MYVLFIFAVNLYLFVPCHILSTGLQRVIGLHVLIFLLACSINCGTLNEQVCVFLKYIQAMKLATGGF